MKTVSIATATALIALTFGGAVAAQAAPTSETTPRDNPGNVCLDTNIQQALAGKKPGDLLAPPQDVTAEAQLKGGALYRVAYATTGEAGSVVASCGLIAVPDDKKVEGVIAWAHGTVGLDERCQASMRPETFVGPMYAGIGAPKAGMDQTTGALYNMLKDGYAVVATDYPSAGMGSPDLQRYVLGVPSGLAVLDSARTLTGNADEFGLSPIGPQQRLPLITWGHSQGGGSALWAGQLARDYLAAQGDQTLNLAGVFAEAPASQFTTSPGQPQAYMGKHLGDRDMYNFYPGLEIPFPIGAVLFSYVTASWSQVDRGTAGAFPFGPTDSVSYQDVLTKKGQATAPVVAGLCLNSGGIPGIAKAVADYLLPDVSRFFAAPFAGKRIDGKWQGAIDATCADPTKFSKGVQDWCAWLQYNMPGPNGMNDFTKIPLDNSGRKVPVYIAQGLNDRIIWCVDTQGQVQGANCLSDQLYHSYEKEYCDGSGYLYADYYPGASHLSLPGAVASNSPSKTYNGSPLDRFVRGAMTGSLSPQCHADDAGGE
jgi:pimeloyl-ACP methyl ester carboxylesterase